MHLAKPWRHVIPHFWRVDATLYRVQGIYLQQMVLAAAKSPSLSAVSTSGSCTGLNARFTWTDAFQGVGQQAKPGYLGFPGALTSSLKDRRINYASNVLATIDRLLFFQWFHSRSRPRPYLPRVSFSLSSSPSCFAFIRSRFHSFNLIVPRVPRDSILARFFFCPPRIPFCFLRCFCVHR